MILSNIKINKFNLKNRVVVSPMCQYSGRNGSPTDWHYLHLLKLLTSGAGMLMLESTAVSKSAKISHSDLCLSNKIQKEKFKNLISFLKSFEKNIPICLQISHAGRKGSSNIPWIKANQALNKQNQSWQTYSASKIKKDKNWPIPLSLNKKQIKKITKNFVNAARYAKQSGFDGLEVHMAHGYLLHQFLSPISNKRNDEYGGNLKNRCRLAFDISRKIRKFWPKNKILGARITGLDHVKNGIKIQDSIFLTKELKKIGFDYVCVSSGGILTKTGLKFYKGFRLKIASEIKKKTGILTRTSGMMEDLDFSNKAIKENKVDLVAIGRSFIKDPNFIFKYAKKKNKNNLLHNQYKRCF